MGVFNDIGNWADNTGFGGWKLSSPNEYKFTYRSKRFGYNNTCKITLDTNFNDSFKVGFKFRF